MSSSPPPQRSGPSPILTGLSLGLFLFALTICSLGLVLLPTLSRELNVVGGVGSSWTPPPPTLVISATPSPSTFSPTPEPTATATLPPLPGQRFQIGEMAMNVNGGPVNLRQSPGYLNKPTNDRIDLVPNGDRLLIVGGPQQADNLTWWQVEWRSKRGWMAESRASGGEILAPVVDQ